MEGDYRFSRQEDINLLKEREGRTASTGKVGSGEFLSSSCPAPLEFTHKSHPNIQSPTFWQL